MSFLFFSFFFFFFETRNFALRVSLLEEEEQKLLCFSLFVQPKAPLKNISTTSRMEERGKRGGEAEETGRESAVVMKNRRRKTSRESFVAKIISLPLFCLVCFFSFLFSGPRRALSKRRKKNARGLPTSRFPGQKLAPPFLGVETSHRQRKSSSLKTAWRRTQRPRASWWPGRSSPGRGRWRPRRACRWR